MLNLKINTVFACLFMLLACGHDIHEGQVIEKYHEPSRIYTYTSMVMIGKTMIPQVHTVYDDEDWIIVVKGVKDTDTIIESFYINESNWKCLSVGDVFNDSIPCSTYDND